MTTNDKFLNIICLFKNKVYLDKVCSVDVTINSYLNPTTSFIPLRYHKYENECKTKTEKKTGVIKAIYLEEGLSSKDRVSVSLEIMEFKDINKGVFFVNYDIMDLK